MNAAKVHFPNTLTLSIGNFEDVTMGNHKRELIHLKLVEAQAMLCKVLTKRSARKEDF